MATIKFYVNSVSQQANVNVYFSAGRKKEFRRKTGFVIDSIQWNKPKSEIKKSLDSKLDKLSIHIKDAYNVSISQGVEVSGEWLQTQIDVFNNKAPLIELDVLTNYIQKYIDDAPLKSLSKGRITNIKLFKSTIERFEREVFKKPILIKNIDLKFSDNYKKWLFNQNYSINYVGKNIANLKTICIDAEKNDVTTSTQLKNIKSLSEKKAPENIIYLNDDEQIAIQNAPIIREALINARKWLLLGCLIGQRGGDLLNITENNIKDLNGIKIIELKQQKTGKLVAIPLLPEAIEILNNGFPYKISLTRFNEYIKDVCEAAGIDNEIQGRVKENNNSATSTQILPKYKLISSHVCRRSFATNFYGRIPTPVLMNVTAHGSEKMFLAYIGKTTYDNAYQMLEYFSKLAPRTKEPEMKVIKNVSSI